MNRNTDLERRAEGESSPPDLGEIIDITRRYGLNSVRARQLIRPYIGRVPAHVIARTINVDPLEVTLFYGELAEVSKEELMRIHTYYTRRTE
jgi:hypothetical protein